MWGHHLGKCQFQLEPYHGDVIQFTCSHNTYKKTKFFSYRFIPEEQVGYPDEDCRKRERQMQFCVWKNGERKLFIRRPDIHEAAVPSPKWAIAAESELGQGYQ
jgi:hypothetical protein